MRWRDRAIVFLLAALTVAGLLLISAFGRPYPVVPAWDGTPQFQADRAWADLVTLATRFPRRWSGTSDRRAAADWITGELRRVGLEVHRDTFAVALGERTSVLMENVWGVSRGTDRADEIVVPLGNYDMAPTSFQAASDTAGHFAAVLELARVIHAMPHRRTFVFLFPDGEEWGMLGARQFARTFPQRGQIVAALSIEDLDPGNLVALGIDGIGQFRGFAPMWMREVSMRSAAREGFPTDEVPPVFEWLQRSILVSFTDQGPFLGQGIPAIDLPGRGDDEALKDRVYHMPDDLVAYMRPAALAAYGRIQERILRSIDALDPIPRESGFYLRLGSDRTVPPLPLLAAQVAVFLPLLAAALVRGRRARLTWAAFADETRGAAAVFMPLLVWLAAVKAMPWVGLMPRYELYPPPPRHPLLTDVGWLPVLVSFGILAAALWMAQRRVRSTRRVEETPGRSAHLAALLILLAAVAGVALADNPFGAVTFLLLPALLWIWVEPCTTRLCRITNAVLVLAGFLVIVALLAQYGALLRIGPYILWYIFMSLAYGQFSLLRLVLALAMTAIGIRLLQITMREQGTGTRELS
ncbi:MAG TPA: M28 family peptidase [bacterium]